MILRRGNMFEDATTHVLIVTTNATVRRDGELVMGRGAAAEMKKRWPLLPSAFGLYVEQHPVYGLVLLRPWFTNNYTLVGIFQVKRYFMDKAELGLIALSTQKLTDIARTTPNLTYSLNFPGIGNGRRTREEVLPIISKLPNNVNVWEL